MTKTLPYLRALERLGASPPAEGVPPSFASRLRPNRVSKAFTPGELARYTGLDAPIRPDSYAEAGRPLALTAAYYQKRGGSLHLGVDLGLRTGTPIRAMANGKVTEAITADYPKPYGLCKPGHSRYDAHACEREKQKIRSRGGKIALCGSTVKIQYATSHDQLESLYCHLSRVDVKKGEMVHAGQIIGLSGNTGNSTGAHLHMQIKLNGQTVDPVPLVDWSYYNVTYRHDSEIPPGYAETVSGAGSANAIPYGLDRLQANNVSVALKPGDLAAYTALTPPVLPKPGGSDTVRITAAYYQRRGSGYHLAVDLGLDAGTPIVAQGPGELTIAYQGDYPKPYGLCNAGRWDEEEEAWKGRHSRYDEASCQAEKGSIESRGLGINKCGTYIQVVYDAGPDGKKRTATYCHLGSIVAGKGRVTRGQLLGYSGNTGNSTGPHLHYALRQEGTSGTIDPVPLTAWAPWKVRYKKDREQPAGHDPNAVSPEGPVPPPGTQPAAPPPAAVPLVAEAPVAPPAQPLAPLPPAESGAPTETPAVAQAGFGTWLGIVALGGMAVTLFKFQRDLERGG